MQNLHRLKTFYEAFGATILKVDNIAESIKNNNLTDADMGQRNGDVRIRFKVQGKLVQLQLQSEHFKLEYSPDLTFNTPFYEFWAAESWGQINFGTLKFDGIAKIYYESSEEMKFKYLDFPIQEEQYFQYSTLVELEEPSFYQYFMDIKKTPSAMLSCFFDETLNYEEMDSVLSSQELIKKCDWDIGLVIAAYMRTNKIG